VIAGILEAAMDAIISINEQQQIVLFNKAAELMFQCTFRDAAGKSLDQFIPSRLRKAHRDHIRAFGHSKMTSRRMGHLGKVLGLRRDGEEFPLEAAISHFETGDGNLYTVILRDITERERQKEALEKSYEELQVLAGRLLTAQEDERRRIARDLHDDMNQRLAVLAFKIQAAQQGFEASSSHAQVLQELYDDLSDVSDNVRHLAYQLHPSVLEDLGLRPALQSLINDYSKLEQIPVTLTADRVPSILPENVSACFYRLTQESLRNIAKYAKAAHVKVTLTLSRGGLQLTVTDDGVGFDPEMPFAKKGLGMLGMQERIRLVNGQLSVKSRPGKGTEISAWAPFPPEAG
jgi:hypothetical protein